MAVDQDVSLLERNQNPLIETTALNLELNDWPLQGHQFNGIVVTNYLFRPHLDQLPAMLVSGGALIYETNAQFGKPSNPNFLLNSGELLALATRHGLKVVAHEGSVYQ